MSTVSPEQLECLESQERKVLQDIPVLPDSRETLDPSDKEDSMVCPEMMANGDWMDSADATAATDSRERTVSMEFQESAEHRENRPMVQKETQDSPVATESQVTTASLD